MLLHELMGVKRFYKYTVEQLMKMFRRMGVKISRGKFGTVFMHPSWDYVYKVMLTDDPQYMDFVEYVMKHPNEHFPTFKRAPIEMSAVHTRSKNEQDRFWVVKIERLNEITDRNLLKFIVHNLESGMSAVYGKQHNDNYSIDFKNERIGVWMPNGEQEMNVSMRDIFKRYPWYESLCAAALHYNEYATEHEQAGVNDNHGGNYMQRDDGTIVFIDPSWAGTNPYQLEREYMQGYYDHGHDDEYTLTKSGPVHPKQAAARKAAEQERAAKEREQRQAQWRAGAVDDDEIPF